MGAEGSIVYSTGLEKTKLLQASDPKHYINLAVSEPFQPDLLWISQFKRTTSSGTRSQIFAYPTPYGSKCEWVKFHCQTSPGPLKNGTLANFPILHNRNDPNRRGLSFKRGNFSFPRIHENLWVKNSAELRESPPSMCVLSVAQSRANDHVAHCKSWSAAVPPSRRKITLY